MNLCEVYDLVMRLFGVDNFYVVLLDKVFLSGFVLDWGKVLVQGRVFVVCQGIVVVGENSVFFDVVKLVYLYNFCLMCDFIDKGGWFVVFFYLDGMFVWMIIVDGGFDDGGVDNWFMVLYMVQVGGLFYCIFVSVFGFVVMMFSIIGVIIWMKK